MRIFISVDMEGISGVETVEEVFQGLPGYKTFRQIMAGDVNAAVQGAIEGGASDIVVSDSHGYMCNIRPKDVHPKATLKSGMKRDLCQFKGFNPSFDGALFIGYHSKAGTQDGILSHTWIPAFQDVRINGLSVGGVWSERLFGQQLRRTYSDAVGRRQNHRAGPAAAR